MALPAKFCNFAAARIGIVLFFTAVLAACGGGGGGGSSAGSGSLPAQLPPAKTAVPGIWNSAVNFTGQRVSTYGCNAVAFAGMPAFGNTYVGRQMNAPAANPCGGTYWSLVLAQLDWNSMAITASSKLVDTSAGGARLGDGTIVQSALDPAIATWQGVTWIAFECEYGGITSTCAGPLNADRTFDFSHSRVLVSGDTSGSASDPKLLVFQGNFYLYWSRVNFANQTVTTRGTQISVNDGSLYASDYGSGGGVEVYGLTSDNAGVADLFQATTDGTTIYLTAGKGGAGCTQPLSGTPGCYRIAIGKTSTPLALDCFNAADWVPDADLPAAPEEYYRFVYRPADGATVLLGGNGAAPQTGGALGGTWAFVWPTPLLHD